MLFRTHSGSLPFPICSILTLYCSVLKIRNPCYIQPSNSRRFLLTQHDNFDTCGRNHVVCRRCKFNAIGLSMISRMVSLPRFYQPQMMIKIVLGLLTLTEQTKSRSAANARNCLRTAIPDL
jgi:hypothetical protein